ncbi:toll/interleukin-1 receptor domain-containing protein [Paraburkholderia sp. A1RO-5]|uniref:toll/interleukin-1 receptor domain-containing protein n=1 Tax=Paraburkholderia sp. A1RO-5 TaxID=3028369 RepID=UPI003B79A4AA
MPSSPASAIDTLALMLLGAFKQHDVRSSEPAFADHLAAELGLGQQDAERAFRYLVEKGLLDTFRLRHAGRINARGHDVLLVSERQQTKNGTAPVEGKNAMEWDVFISHASEDKADVALPLAERLRAEGLRVWLDSFELTVGDSLRQSIERGLAGSRFGIVIISPEFLQKHWPQAELDGLAARETAGVKVILPVWHRVNEAAVRAQSPMLAGRLAVTTDKGGEHVASELMRAIRRDASQNARAPESSGAPAASAAPPADLPRLGEIAKTFHSEQTELIATGQGPSAVLDGGMLVLHILPYAFVEGRAVAAYDELARQPELFPPMKGTVQDVQIGYNGVLIGSNAQGLGVPQRAYVKIDRTGAIEAVISSLATGQSTRWVELPYVQALVIRYVTDYVRAVSRFSVAPPFAVSVSLANMQGVRLLQDFKGSAFAEDIPFGQLNQDRLPFGQVVLEAVPPDYRATARVLKPILTHLANAAGLAAPPNFDEDGNYKLDLRSYT